MSDIDTEKLTEYLKARLPHCNVGITEESIIHVVLPSPFKEDTPSFVGDLPVEKFVAQMDLDECPDDLSFEAISGLIEYALIQHLTDAVHDIFYRDVREDV